jgi:hypothetical protein
LNNKKTRVFEEKWTTWIEISCMVIHESKKKRKQKEKKRKRKYLNNGQNVLTSWPYLSD